MKLTIIGSGRAAWAFSQASPIFDELTIGARSHHPAFGGLGAELKDLESALRSAGDFLLLAIPDDSVPRFWSEHRAVVPPDTLPFHASGRLSSSVFGERPGFSLHPLAALPAPGEAVDLTDVLFVFEGAPEAETIASRITVSLGGRFSPIDPDAKELYHASAVFASNYLAALLGIAERLMNEAGVDLPRKSLRRLAISAIEGWLEGNYTGPIARGDVETIRAHINRLNERDGALYRALGEHLTELFTRQPESVPSLQKEDLRKLVETLRDG